MATIGFHARITNSLTRGYYAYLACFDSWRKVADRVVVVDGNSTDNTVSFLLEWISNDQSVTVLSNEQSHWGRDFAWEQSTLNMQLGHEALKHCDWIIRADADHVIDTKSATNLADVLDTECSEQLFASFDVESIFDGQFRKRHIPRNWIINNRLARERGIRIGWGIDNRSKDLSDSPLLITDEGEFVDPETGVLKPILSGNLQPLGQVVPLRVCRYGHFFFTRDQSIEKVETWMRAVTRYRGKQSWTRFSALVQADVLGISRFLAKKEVLEMDHPAELKRVIEQFYQPNMLGGARYYPGITQLNPSLRLVEKVTRRLFS